MIRAVAAAGLIGVIQAGCAPALHAATASTTYQVDPAHDGNLTMRGFAPPLKLLWSRKLDGYAPYPIVSGRMVFVAVNNTADNTGTKLNAIDIRSGRVLWRRHIGDNFGAALAYDNGLVFAVDSEGNLQAITADRTATVRYTKQLNESGLPVAQNGSLYIGGGKLLSIEELSGNVQWTAAAWPGDYPVLGGDGVYVTSSCTYAKFDPLTGRQKWVYYFGCTGGGVDSAYFSRRLYVRDDAGQLVLDTKTGKPVNILAADATPAFYRNAAGKQFEYTLFNNQIYGIDLATGNVIWSFAGDGQLSTPPMIINGMVVEGSKSGQLYLLDRANGVVLWSTNVGAPIDEGCPGCLRGLGGGDGKLIVPALDQISAYVPG